MKLVPNSYIHVSVSDLYIPRKGFVNNAVSFLGIHRLEPDIYIGFSPALHLQCRNKGNIVLSRTGTESITWIASSFPPPSSWLPGAFSKLRIPPKEFLKAGSFSLAFCQSSNDCPMRRRYVCNFSTFADGF
jgi:hypothetical protein